MCVQFVTVFTFFTRSNEKGKMCKKRAMPCLILLHNMSQKLSLMQQKKKQKPNSIVKITGCIFNYNNAHALFCFFLWALNSLNEYPVFVRLYKLMNKYSEPKNMDTIILEILERNFYFFTFFNLFKGFHWLWLSFAPIY